MKKNYLLKKIGCLLLATTFAISAVACGATEETDTGSRKTQSASEEKTSPENKAPKYTANELTGDIKASNISYDDLDDDEKEDITYAIADYTTELFKLSCEEAGSDANVLISPASINYAFSLAANGAANNSRELMEDIMYGGYTVEELNSYMQSIKPNNNCLKIANSIWFRDDEDRLTVNPEFLETNKSIYDAQVFKAAFDNSTVDDVNNWTNYYTDGMIPTLLDDINEDSVMFLINAVAFDAEWATEYNEDAVKENNIFTNSQGEEEQVAMLYSKEGIYLEDDSAIGVAKMYKGGDYAFVAMLPNEDVSLSEYVEDFDGAAFIDMYNDSEYTDVYTKIPEFTYSYDTDLVESLKEIGLSDLCDDGADFSNMATTTSNTLKIGHVIHKTFIEVNRKGTKAAAATLTDMTEVTCAIEEELPKYVYLDRPFLYAIVDTHTGTPVFIGTVNTCE